MVTGTLQLICERKNQWILPSKTFLVGIDDVNKARGLYRDAHIDTFTHIEDQDPTITFSEGVINSNQKLSKLFKHSIYQTWALQKGDLDKYICFVPRLEGGAVFFDAVFDEKQFCRDEFGLVYDGDEVVAPESDGKLYWLLVVEGDIEPNLLGPFSSEEVRDEEAKEHRRRNGDEDGLYPIVSEGDVQVDAYSGLFFNED